MEFVASGWDSERGSVFVVMDGILCFLDGIRGALAVYTLGRSQDLIFTYFADFPWPPSLFPGRHPWPPSLFPGRHPWPASLFPGRHFRSESWGDACAPALFQAGAMLVLQPCFRLGRCLCSGLVGNACAPALFWAGAMLALQPCFRLGQCLRSSLVLGWGNACAPAWF